ncbi:hypothetical protein C8R44DRAFT_884993 [Mycena epipterygia]|nr:hypothetical protein C8R44DRAFT_884993 [Mycena epipterygia]
MAAAFEPGSFDANGTIGALEIGVLASYILLGVETTQAYIYYSRFPKDPRKIKLLVAFIWICELGHSVCIGHALYIVTISDYGHPERILRVPQSLDTTIFLSGLIGASVQCFFASRIYMLTGNPVVSSFCWMLSFLRLLGCTVLFAYALGMSDVTVFDAHWGWLFNTIWAISSTNDISIAATLVYTLYQQRATLQSKKTIVLLDKIINWTLGSFLPVSQDQR